MSLYYFYNGKSKLHKKMINFSKSTAQYSLGIKINWLLSHVFFRLNYFENILIIWKLIKAKET